ncbi:MAG TPA: hypothetical protein VFA26_24165 [Gemmataceae bacterium]|nr:hypothetical protein [Gemmataceae bacterium]
MRTRWLPLALLLGLGLASVGGVRTTAADKADADRIAKLIQQLGSDSYAERSRAAKDLEGIGAPALQALKKAAASDDLEVRKAAEALVKKIEARAQVEKLLAPKRVKLACKDTPLKEALADFQKQSGYTIQLHDPENKLADRKVTLETGEVSFWEALDLFCKKAGLKEATPQDLFRAPPPPRGGPLPPVKGGPGVAPGQPGQTDPAVPPAAPAKPVPARPAKPAPVEKEQPVNQAAVVRVQAVAAPGGAAQVQVQIAPPGKPVGGPVARPGGRPFPALSPTTITLVDGKADDVPTHYAGAVRVRGLKYAFPPIPNPPPAFLLEVRAEPKLQIQGLAGVKIDKALDDKDQKLTEDAGGPNGPGGFPVPPGGFPAPPLPPGGIGGAGFGGFVARPPVWFGGMGSHQHLVRFKKGDKESKSLKEVSGTVSAQVLTPPEPVLTVDNVMKAAGKTVKGKDGGSIKVVDAKADDNGRIQVQVEVEMPPGIIPGGVGGFGGGVILPGGPVQIQPAPLPIQIAPPPPPPAPPGGGKGFRFQAQPAVIQVRQAQVQIQIAPGAAPQPAIAIAPAYFGGGNGLQLLDGKGQPIQLVGQGLSFQPGAKGPTWNLTFQPKKGQEAAKLVFTGSRSVTVDIPFTLKNVPLQ